MRIAPDHLQEFFVVLTRSNKVICYNNCFHSDLGKFFYFFSKQFYESNTRFSICKGDCIFQGRILAKIVITAVGDDVSPFCETAKIPLQVFLIYSGRPCN